MNLQMKLFAALAAVLVIGFAVLAVYRSGILHERRNIERAADALELKSLRSAAAIDAKMAEVWGRGHKE